jgi:hypothetical protein
MSNRYHEREEIKWNSRNAVVMAQMEGANEQK